MDAGRPATRSWRRAAYAIGVLIALAVATAPIAGSREKPPYRGSLRSPDGGATCVATYETLVCTNDASQARAVPVVLEMTLDDAPHVVRRIVHWTDAAAKLRAGTTRRLGPFSCRATADTLICGDRAGNALAVSRGRIAVLIGTAVSP